MIIHNGHSLFVLSGLKVMQDELGIISNSHAQL